MPNHSHIHNEIDARSQSHSQWNLWWITVRFTSEIDAESQSNSSQSHSQWNWSPITVSPSFWTLLPDIFSGRRVQGYWLLNSAKFRRGGGTFHSPISRKLHSLDSPHLLWAFLHQFGVDMALFIWRKTVIRVRNGVGNGGGRLVLACNFVRNGHQTLLGATSMGQSG